MIFFSLLSFKEMRLYTLAWSSWHSKQRLCVPAHFKSISEKHSGLISLQVSNPVLIFCGNRGLADEGDKRAALHARPNPFIAPRQSHHMPYHRPKLANGKKVVESGDSAPKDKENLAWLFLLLGNNLSYWIFVLCFGVCSSFLTEKSKRPRKLVINHTKICRDLEMMKQDQLYQSALKYMPQTENKQQHM